ncbi:MAG: GMC family oxidoreductase [Acetobacteraceae bacterium]|nr:GMC family oxidoreductase [Acetobacteraceae bacterium]
MFAEFHPLAGGTDIEADVCIAGAGAAGITLALALAGSGLHVLLLEGGGLDFEDEVQALYAGENAGLEYYPLDACRLRYFGGTTNHWGGRSQPLSPWDFAERPWVPHSGWPAGLAEELDHYYPRAHEICGLGPFAYSPEVLGRLGAPVPPLDPERLRYALWRYSAGRQPGQPVLFGEDHRERLRQAGDVRVLLHANLTAIRLDPAARRVAALEVRSPAGATATVRARCHVLACGGIENARLMLLSDDVEPHGVGNRHDLVGRFFMEHPDARCGVLRPSGAAQAAQLFRYHSLDGRTILPGLHLAPELQAAEGALGCAAGLWFENDPESPALALRDIYRDLARGRWPGALGRKLATVLGDLDRLAGDAYWRAADQVAGTRSAAYRTGLLNIEVELEQAPNPDSRVTLAGERDALGLRRARLDWKLTELDRRSLLVFTKAVGAEFARLGLGRVKVADWLLDGGEAWGGDMHGSFHHLGTTRMADDPRRGVVDRDCRVHGIDNLYVATGSVFPTAGPSNPTLTIVALALRLADCLKERLARSTGAPAPRRTAVEPAGG